MQLSAHLTIVNVLGDHKVVFPYVMQLMFSQYACKLCKTLNKQASQCIDGLTLEKAPLSVPVVRRKITCLNMKFFKEGTRFMDEVQMTFKEGHVITGFPIPFF